MTDKLFSLPHQAQAAKPPLSKLYLALFLLGSLDADAAEAQNTKKAKQKPYNNDTPVMMEPMTVTATAPLNPPNGKPQLDVQTATGSRLGLTARETPGSITVIDRATLEKRGAYTTQEALERAPGVMVSSQPGSAGSVSMRGFTGTQITQLYNGITVQYDVIAARPTDSWLLDRVEVLGGPSTFLYGQGAVGGSINYVSKLANREDTHQSALFSLGEFLHRRAAYGYGGQLGNTKNWVRADISYAGSEGYYNNNETNSGEMAFSLLSDITDRLSNTLAVEHKMAYADAYWGTPVLNPTINGKIVEWGNASITSPIEGQIDPGTRFQNYNAKNPAFDQQVTWIRDILDFQLSDSTQLKNTLYYYQADRQYRNVEVYDWNATNTQIARSASLATEHDQMLLGNRVEAVHDTSLFSLPTKVSAGIDVAYNKQTRFPSTESGVVSTIDPYNYTVGSYYDNPKATGPIASARNELLTVAGYAESRITLLPKLNLVTGVRVDDITLDQTNYRTPTAPTVANPFGSPAAFSRHWQAVTWRAGLIYDITPTFNVYAQYSTAADPPSGLLTTGNIGNFRNFDLTTGRQGELGTKFDFWDGRGSATLAGFYIERNNLSTRDPQNSQLTIPVGAQSSAGVEVNLGLKITPEWSLQGNMAYVDATYDEFTEAVGTASVSRAGNRPTNIAKWVANAWVTWDFHPDWQWNFGTRYVDDRYVDNANLIIAPAYAVFDTQMAWHVHKNVTVTARVKNLTDEVYAEWGNGGDTPMFLLREPRMFQMELKLDF